MTNQIPPRNIFYIFCYAWRLIREGKAITVGTTDSPDAGNFYARVLSNAVALLLRRGLERGYRVYTEDLSALRGRVQLGPSYRRMLLQQGKAVCEYDELSHDTLNNQIVKATLNSLVKVSSLDGNLRSRITKLLKWISEVSSIQLKLSHFGQVNVHRNNSYDRLTLKLCELIYSLLMPTEGAGKFFLTDVVHDETRMSTVFEEFIREFYRTEAKAFRSVRREDIHWASDIAFG